MRKKRDPDEIAPGSLTKWLHPTAARRPRLVQPHLVTITHSDHLLLLGFPWRSRRTNFASRQALAHRTTFVRSNFLYSKHRGEEVKEENREILRTFDASTRSPVEARTRWRKRSGQTCEPEIIR